MTTDGLEATGPGAPGRGAIRALGTALLVVSAAASAMLVVEHFGNSLPGCGPKSACAELDASVWGRVPGLNWPVSFLGLGWFVALLAAWLSLRSAIPAWFRNLVRAGGLVSLLLLGVMLAKGQICPYCLTVHVANLAFLGLLETSLRRSASPVPAGSEPSARKAGRVARGRKAARAGKAARQARSGAPVPAIRAAGARRSLALGAGAFVVVTLGLAIAEAQTQEIRAARAEADRAASVQKMVRKSEGSASAHPAGSGEEGSGEKNTGPFTGRDLTDPNDLWGASGFTGRYRYGPENAPIRIVLLTDYQCPDCYKIENELDGILKSRQDVSVSIKQFPMCREAAPGVLCNKYASRTLHPNACWAARAAEAAGILGGNDGFWKMHRWLFARRGEFTDSELAAEVAELGFDAEKFRTTMAGQETLDRVRSDVEEGKALGLWFTPMIFINGVELKGWNMPNALTRTVAEVAASHPPPGRATDDHPELAAEKYVSDWQDRAPSPIAPDRRSWPLGVDAAGDPAVDVVVFGDYLESRTALVDAEIRAAMKGRNDVRYNFRHYPVEKECNPTLPAEVPEASIHPGACRASRAAEAAGSLGGVDAYWAMHEWLLQNQRYLTDPELKAAAKEIGLNGDALLTEMQSAEVTDAIAEDCRAALQLGIRSIPMVFVNRKQVPRPFLSGDHVMTRIIERAGER